jgi:hypothetical protein
LFFKIIKGKIAIALAGSLDDMRKSGLKILLQLFLVEAVV